MNEIVKYNNYMNTLHFKGFTSVDLNVLMTLCNRLRNKKIERMEFSFEELRELTGYKQTSNTQFIKDIKRMNDKLQKVACSLENDEEIISFVLFPTYQISKAKRTLTVAVNTDFQFVLNNLANNFTRFELEEFVKLESKYSKSLYRLLKQWRKTGKMIVNDVDDFRDKLDCPKSYTNGIFVRDVLNPSIEDLTKSFKNLKCVPLYARKKGKPLIGFEFTFDVEMENSTSNVQIEEQMNVEDSQQYMSRTKESNTPKTKNKFNQFPQRNYNMSELEKQIHEKQNSELEG